MGGVFGGGGGSGSYGGGRGDFFSAGWKPGQGSLSAGSFARMDAMHAQAQGARDTQLGFGLLPGSMESSSTTGYYTFMLSPAVYSTQNGRIEDSHWAVGTVDFGKSDYLAMYANAGIPIGSQQYYSSNSTSTGSDFRFPYNQVGLGLNGLGTATTITKSEYRYFLNNFSKSSINTLRSASKVLGVAGLGLTIYQFGSKLADKDQTLGFNDYADLTVGTGTFVAGLLVANPIGLAVVAGVGIGYGLYTLWRDNGN
jgi:hypothetical protein